MKRKLVYAGAAWAAGLLTAAMSVQIFAALAVALLTAFLFKTLVRFNLKSIIFMLVTFVIAFGYYRVYDYTVYNKIIEYSGKSISYSGRITDINNKAGDKSFYTLSGEINDSVNASLMLYTDSVVAEVGDTLSFECIPQIPENNYLFNSRDYYKAKGSYLVAYSAEKMTINPCTFSVRNLLFDFRESVSSAIEMAIPEKESAMLKGMLFGDKTGFEEDDKSILYRVGIGHVTAVSGFHLVLFCSVISFVLKRFNLGKTAQFIATEFMMLLFVMCCGMSPSVLRSFIMMTLINLAPLFFRYTDSLNSICIAVIMLTLPNPFVILNQSFLLSVSGALGMGVFGRYMTKNIHATGMAGKVGKKLLHMLCVFVVTAPVSAFLTGEVSFISPLTNLVLVPLCMVALVISMAGALLFWFDTEIIFKTAGTICSFVLNISDFLNKIRFIYGRLGGDFVPYVLAVMVMLCVAGYLIFRNRKFCAGLIAVCMSSLFIISAVYSLSDRDTMKIALLGKNDAEVIVVVKNNSADIIDVTGEYKNSQYAEKYVRELGISRINNLIMIENTSYSMAAYNNRFSLFDVGNVVVPSGTYINNDYIICGCKPKFSDFSVWSADYGEYRISVDNEKITAEYGTFALRYENGGYNGKNMKIILLYTFRTMV
ncbi:MAG: ComEC/Rec2 family competence protein [Oscillospiraceae bacterium]|nr:ComEC/Rec2 family competence protein [Oscillospiraceae bacterium]